MNKRKWGLSGWTLLLRSNFERFNRRLSKKEVEGIWKFWSLWWGRNPGVSWEYTSRQTGSEGSKIGRQIEEPQTGKKEADLQLHPDTPNLKQFQWHLSLISNWHLWVNFLDNFKEGIQKDQQWISPIRERFMGLGKGLLKGWDDLIRSELLAGRRIWRKGIYSLISGNLNCQLQKKKLFSPE